MGVRGRAALALVLAVALGCQTTLVGKLRKSFREPGQRLVELPAEVAEEYECGGRELPYFELERLELVPLRLAAGGEFNHRMVYALCPSAPTQVVRGTLETRIRFKGEPIVSERIEGFEIKPGRWVVDAFIQLPKDAEEGVYALELDFESREVDFEERLTFGVDAS